MLNVDEDPTNHNLQTSWPNYVCHTYAPRGGDIPISNGVVAVTESHRKDKLMYPRPKDESQTAKLLAERLQQSGNEDNIWSFSRRCGKPPLYRTVGAAPLWTQPACNLTHLAETMTASPSLQRRPGMCLRHCLDSRKRPGKNTEPAAKMLNMLPVGPSLWLISSGRSVALSLWESERERERERERGILPLIRNTV